MRAHSVYETQLQKLSDEAVGVLAQEVLSHLSTQVSDDILPGGQLDKDALEAFCDALTGDDGAVAADIIMQARGDGVSVESIYLGYLAGAARMLGDRWEDDRVTFMQVTVASGRIYAIMRGLRRFLAPILPDQRRHALFVSMPDDDHTLGVTMAADLFRQKGWDIQLETHRSLDQLIQALKQSDHTIIGVSASRPETLVDLARLVVSLRICKPHSFILVSGHITEMEPDIVDLVDADAFAGSVPSAITQLEQLVTDLEQRAG
ncbi:MAG: cobalamin-dependent protein [Pseudomonadota bacterium]